MRSFRSKPVGWQNDNYRHYLAAKGYRSTVDYSRMNVLDVARETDEPGFDKVRFAEFMRKRFPHGESTQIIGGAVVDRVTVPEYAREWRDRFVKGDAWQHGDYRVRELLKEVYPEIYGGWDKDRSEYREPKGYEDDRAGSDLKPIPPEEGWVRTPVFTSYLKMVAWARVHGKYEGYTSYPLSQGGEKFVGYYTPIGGGPGDGR